MVFCLVYFTHIFQNRRDSVNNKNLFDHYQLRMSSQAGIFHFLTRTSFRSSNLCFWYKVRQRQGFSLENT